ncbi:MAG: tetratricopeptide repeat protein [Bacteroidota bacterium]
MKTFIIATIFFYLLKLFFLQQLFAQDNRRIKLIDAQRILLNGDTVLIATQTKAFQQDIRQNIINSCRRNLDVALASMKAQPKKAYFFLNEALKLDSTFIPTYAALAKLYVGIGNYKKALAVIDKAILQQEDESLSLARALIYRKMGEDKQALCVANEMIENKPHSIAASYLKTSILYSRNEYKAALAQLTKEKIASTDTSFYRTQLTKAILFVKNGQREESLKLLEVLMKQDGQNSLALYQLAFAYNQEEKFHEALPLLNTAIRQSSSFLAAYFLRGQVHYRLAQFEQAIKDFQLCVENDFMIDVAYTNLSASFFKSKIYEQAEDAASKAIETNQNLGEAFINRGNAREMLRKEKAACEDWQSAVSLGFYQISPLIDGFCEE